MAKFTSPQGLEWCYDVEGEGPVLLFLHGWGVNRRIWRQQTKHFSRSYCAISVDLPGHGQSGWKPLPLAGICGELRALLDALSVPAAGVVASSFGGLLALKLLEDDPDRVRLMVFVGSQGKFARSGDYPYGLDVERIRKLSGQMETHYPSMVHIFFRSLFTVHERESRRFRWIQTFRRTDDIPRQDALLGMLKILEDEDLREVLHRIDRPVQFINGVEDPICHRDLYAEIRRRLPHARFDWFERCGHFPFLSRPHEFNEVLADFLDEHRGALCS